MHDDRKTITQGEALAAIIQALNTIIEQNQRSERRFHEFAKTYLDARFPYGKGTDRWSRSR